MKYILRSYGWFFDFLVVFQRKMYFQGDTTKNKRGKAYKARSDSEYKCFESHEGVLYRPGDHVFIEVSQCDPYYIGTISNFKMVLPLFVQILILKMYIIEKIWVLLSIGFGVSFW